VSTLVDRLSSRVVPALLGPGVRRLLPSVWAGQLADGIALAAGPLAVASLTHAPLPVAGAVALHRLPVLLLGPYAATLADRAHRRTLVVGSNVLRVLLLLLVALLLAVGHASVAGLLVCFALLGLLETVGDAAAGPIPAMLAHDAEALDVTQARVDAGFIAGTQLAGPVLGALLFTVGSAVPFAAHGALLVAACWLLAGVPVPGPSRVPLPAALRRPVRTGLCRIAVDPALSALVLAGLASQVAWAAGWSVLVLLAAGPLGLGALGFGLLVVAGAVGGLAGALVHQRIRALLSESVVIRAGLAVEAGSHLLLAVAPAVGSLVAWRGPGWTSAWPAFAAVALLGAVGFVWSAAVRARRTELVPSGQREVVTAAVVTLSLTATVVGSLIGGVLATLGGLPAAYGGAVVVSLAALALFWRRLRA
jgi:MFS family permease